MHYKQRTTRTQKHENRHSINSEYNNKLNYYLQNRNFLVSWTCHELNRLAPKFVNDNLIDLE